MASLGTPAGSQEDIQEASAADVVAEALAGTAVVVAGTAVAIAENACRWAANCLLPLQRSDRFDHHCFSRFEKAEV